ncbi:MAG: VanZ family protein [Firmicutes bacterium]|nr:VanZ family protein [Bacillota bacterium]
MINTALDAVNDIWPMLVIFVVIITTIRLTYLSIHKEKFIFYKEFLNLVFIIYVLLLYQLLTNVETNTSSGYNLVPFTEIMRYKFGSRLFMTNVVGNILIFVPFGYFVSGYIRASKVGHILAVSIISSLVVEVVQLQIGRSFDVDDILLNVSGAILGFLVYIGLCAIKKHLPRFLQKNIVYDIICVVITMLIVVYFLRLMGFWWF